MPLAASFKEECATSHNLEDKPLIWEGCSVVDISTLNQGSGNLVAAGQQEDQGGRIAEGDGHVFVNDMRQTVKKGGESFSKVL